jgi:hypothetical protein
VKCAGFRKHYRHPEGVRPVRDISIPIASTYPIEHIIVKSENFECHAGHSTGGQNQTDEMKEE